QGNKVRLLRTFGRAGVTRDAALFEKIEDILTAIHAFRAQRAFLFREVVEPDMFEWDVIEVEIPLKPQSSFGAFREPAPEDSPRGYLARKPSQRPQAGKGRALRIMNEIAPIPMLNRPAPRKNRWHASRTVAE